MKRASGAGQRRGLRRAIFAARCVGAFAAGAILAAAEPIDRPLPGGAGGSLTVHVEAGRRERAFHVTFERGGRGHYVYFDGREWGAAQAVTAGAPFRSGVHLAIDAEDRAHLAWVEGAGDRGGTLWYRTSEGGRVGSAERVHAPLGWNECDIAVDRTGAPLIAANTEVQAELAVYERGAAGWSRTVLPSENREDKWAPSIVCADEDLVFVASRRKRRHPFTWRVRAAGQWSVDAALPVRSYEPNAIPHGAGMIASSLDGFVYFVAAREGKFETWHRDVRAMRRGVIRGQHVGIALTRRGTLVLLHSDMTNANLADRRIGPEHRCYLSYSRDLGATWTLNQPVAEQPGQGHGNLAANGDWVMLVWPDRRDGGGIRYSLRREPLEGTAPGKE